MDEKEIRKESKRLIKEGKKKEAFLLLYEHDLLPYCPRLHLKAFKLPCGEREECFGGHCPNLPKGAVFRIRFNAPYGK